MTIFDFHYGLYMSTIVIKPRRQQYVDVGIKALSESAVAVSVRKHVSYRQFMVKSRVWNDGRSSN